MHFSKKYFLGALLAAVPLGLIGYQQFTTPSCGMVMDGQQRELLNQIDAEMTVKLRRQRSIFSHEICQMPASQLARAIAKVDQPKPDHPGEARSFRFQQQASENKQLNVENWKAARQQVKRQRQFQRQDAGINRNNWESLGPGNIGGRIRSLAFDPDNSQRIYAGAVAGGVWLTENGGASWAPTDDFMANLSVSTLIVDPNDADIIYAGTGEGTFNADNVRGLGIFKSIDRGVSWSQLENTNDDFDFYWVNRLTMLNDSSRIVAATHTGIWVSDDAGVTWTQQYSGRTFDVDAHPSDANLLVAGTAGGVQYSTDGGDNWNSAGGLGSIGSGRVEISYARGTPTSVYASIDSSSGEIYKSTDGGQSFSLVNTGESYLGSQGWYDNALWVDPLDEDHLIVGGIDLWRSTDGGASLTKISTWWMAPDSAHADHHFIIEHPDYDGSTNQQVYFANDGGVYTAEDVTVASDDTGWQELNNQLAITQFYGMGVAPDGTLVAGTQDNGTLVYKGDSEAWTATFGGDGGFSAADPTDSNYLYGEYVYLQIHRSTNGGNGSSYIHDSAMETSANFIAPFILDPNNENRLLGGSNQLWASDNAKATSPTWSSIKAAIPSNSKISAIGVAPGDSDTIYVGHNNGSLYKTSNGTDPAPSWNELVSVNLPGRYLMRVVVDPNDNQVVYAAFGGYNAGNLKKSIDGGVTWNDASGSEPSNIPTAPVRTIVINPSDSQQLYVGTEVGIFASEDGGTTWSLENNGPANVSVDELVWFGEDTLYAATHGRGIYRTQVNDNTPDDINFTNLLDVALSSEQLSEEQTILGLGIAADLSISTGEYSLGCDGNFTTANTTVNNDQTICLRHTAASDYYTEVTTALTIGTKTFEFTSRTLPDITPDAIAFDSVTDAELGASQVSNQVSVTGISNEVDISIDLGEYAINCIEGNYTNAPGTISLNDTLCLRHSASDEHLVSVTSTVSVGDSDFTFTSTTLPDTTPDAFSFDSVEQVLIGSQQTSEAITINGIQIAVPISISNGEYSIGCSSSFTGNDGEIDPAASVCVRHNASADYLTANTSTLTIGGVSGDFVSTTSNDVTPDSFSFSSLTNVETGSVQVSEAVSVSGIAVAVDISVVGGEYSIGCDGSFTASSGTINPDETVCVRHTSSSSFSSQVETTLTVGRSSASFSSTTKAAPASSEDSSSSGGGSIAWLGLFILSLFGRIRNKRL